VNFVRHLFIPHQNNNYRAKSLHPDFLTIYLVFALVLTFAFKKTGVNVLGFATDITVNKLTELTNEQRVKNNLPSLTYSDCLSKAAYQKAQDMFSKNYWAHYAPDGKTPWDFMLSAGCNYETAGENLAKNFMFSSNVVDAWMNSETHRANILNNTYTEVGFAIVNGVLNGEQTTLVVQMFNKPTQVVAAQKAPLFEPKTVSAKEEIIVDTAPKKNIEQVLSIKNQPVSKTKTNISNISLNINIIFFIFLFIALGLDFYFAAKFNIIRVGGKNLAHFVFILFLFLGLIYIYINGSII